MIFESRQKAGIELAKTLQDYKSPEPFIFGLARGGVIVAVEVAKILKAPIDVIVVRKIGMPGYPELGIGAIAPGNIKILNHDLIARLNIPNEIIENVILEEKKEMERRLELYREGTQIPNLYDKNVIIIDDGIATGITAEAAVEYVRRMNPKKIIFASPVCAPNASKELGPQVDDFRCLYTPYDFIAVGQYYKSFEPTKNGEIINILENGKRTNKNSDR